MKKVKKINCKDGLDRKQEIQARRIKEILLKKEEDNEYLKKLKDIYNDISEDLNEILDLYDKNQYFRMYLRKVDIVLYSAYVRADFRICDFIK